MSLSRSLKRAKRRKKAKQIMIPDIFDPRLKYPLEIYDSRAPKGYRPATQADIDRIDKRIKRR